MAGGLRPVKPGLYYGPHLMSADATFALVQNTEYVQPFLVGTQATFDRIGLEVTTLAASNVVRLGIRADDGSGYPSTATALLDAGTIDASATGFKEITISQVLPPGLWWVSATLQGGTGASVRIRNNSPLVGQTVTSTSNACGFSQTGVTGALGAFTATPASSAAGVKILMRAA